MLLPTPADNKTDLLPRIASGDANAVELCIAKYGNLVYSIALKMVSNNTDAEDLTQEIFVEIWRSAGRFNATESPEIVFISMIARRKCIDRIRKNSAAKILKTVELVDEMSKLVDKEHIEKESDNEDADKIMTILNHLPEEQRKSLLLAIVNGLTHSEIAENLSIPLGTVKTNIRRGMQAIRDEYAVLSNNHRKPTLLKGVKS